MRIKVISILIFFVFFAVALHAQVLRKRTVKLMGSKFDITIVAKDSLTAEQHIDTVIAEVERIENLISDWRPYTQIGQINEYAGIKPIKVDEEVFQLAKRGLYFSSITHGAFDISFAAMDRIWKFDGSMEEMPSPEAIRQSVAKVGYQKIVLDSVHRTIFLKEKGMKIGFGALGEGYAADRCKTIMLAKGIKAGIVNGSGDMNTWGKQPNGKDWNIGITNPFDNHKLLAVVPLESGAITTSGSYEKFVEFNGVRYAHIINPKTGYPATGLCSATVFGPSAEFANGLSTSIMVLGKVEGLELLAKYPGYKALLITDDGKVITSPNLDLKKLRYKKVK